MSTTTIIIIIIIVAIIFYNIGKSRKKSGIAVNYQYPPISPRPPSPQPPIVSEKLKSLNPLPDNFELSEDFRKAFELMENSGESIFISGQAGTGKSTLLQHFRQNTKKSIVVLAPTGVAALNVGGQTIHSFFKFPPRALNKEDIRKTRDSELFKKINTIIIDEVSMVRADLLDAIDMFMRVNGRNSSLPFGGTQIIFFGDLYQLPPVVSHEEESKFFSLHFESPYFFSAEAFESILPEYIELKKIYRQTDASFIELLGKIRHNNLLSADVDKLNTRVMPSFTPTGFIKLLL